jgi:hypothetical protein
LVAFTTWEILSPLTLVLSKAAHISDRYRNSGKISLMLLLSAAEIEGEGA